MNTDKLFWVVTDQYGRPCNGGNREERLEIGKWSPRIDDVKICKRGYHCTTDPLRWAGLLVWLVEVDEIVGMENDKVVCHTRRPISCVDPAQCVDVRIWVAASRPYLRGADLRGADTEGWERGPDGYARRKKGTT
jgi:hypothetical protein